MEFEPYLDQSQELARSDEYVLCVLSAAVRGGASWLKLEENRSRTRLTWDGAALDLELVLPRLGRSDSPEAELAPALLAAARLGEVSLQSGPVRLNFRGKQPRFEAAAPTQFNSLTVRRPWWRWTAGGSRALELFHERARFATLRLQGAQAPERLSVELAVLVGGTCPDWFMTQERIVVPGGEWGHGLVYLKSVDWRVIRHGVTYVFPSPWPGIGLHWWCDRLPPDLSRRQLLPGPEWEAWLGWLHDLLAERLWDRPAWVGPLLRASRHCRNERFLQAEMFRMADGSRTCLTVLRADYQEHGWLPVITRPALIDWEPQRVVLVQEPHEKALLQVFPNWLNLDYLDGVTDIPRLPVGEDYLVRVPLRKGKGEAGLRRYLDTIAFRERVDGSWESRRAHPFGVDLVREPRGAEVPVGELYWTLKLMKTPEAFKAARTFHLLAMFALLRSLLAKQFASQYLKRHPLAVLLHPAHRVRVGHGRGRIGTPQLQAVAEELKFRLHSGEQVGLLNLCHRGPYRYTMSNLMGPPDALLLDIPTYGMLAALLRPGTLVAAEWSPAFLLVTTTAQWMLGEVAGPLQLIQRLLTYRRCSAYKVAEASGQLEHLLALASDSEPSQPEPWWPSLPLLAAFDMHARDRALNTAYLLLVTLRELGWEEAAGRLIPTMLDWAEYETIQEFQEIASIHPVGSQRRDNMLKLVAHSWMRSRRLDEAREVMSRLEQTDEVLWGTLECLDGNLEKGLEHFRTAKRPTDMAEVLMLLGRLDEARATLKEDERQYGLVVRASLTESPEECLRLCDQAEKLGPEQYFELAEVRARAYLQLGQRELAQLQLLRFLEARPDNCLAEGLEQRLRAARETLEGLG